MKASSSFDEAWISGCGLADVPHGFGITNATTAPIVPIANYFNIKIQMKR